MQVLKAYFHSADHFQQTWIHLLLPSKDHPRILTIDPQTLNTGAKVICKLTNLKKEEFYFNFLWLEPSYRLCKGEIFSSIQSLGLEGI